MSTGMGTFLAIFGVGMLCFVAGMFLGEHSYKQYLYAKGSSSYHNLVKLKDRRFIITEFKSVDKHI